MLHKRLLLKVKVHGIGDGIIDWLGKWLTEEVVVVNWEVPNWKSVLSVAPKRFRQCGFVVCGKNIKYTDK